MLVTRFPCVQTLLNRLFMIIGLLPRRSANEHQIINALKLFNISHHVPAHSTSLALTETLFASPFSGRRPPVHTALHPHIRLRCGIDVRHVLFNDITTQQRIRSSAEILDRNGRRSVFGNCGEQQFDACSFVL